MKKSILLLFAAVLFTACGATKIERQAQHTLKGDWTLDRISFPDSEGVFTVDLFDDASASCFTGSDWHFIPNNNHGSYTINSSDCGMGERHFIFDVMETTKGSGNFVFTLKPVADKENPRKVDTGYRMDLVNLNANNMVWEQHVFVDGESFTIRLQFSKK